MAACDTIIYFTGRMADLAEFYRRGLNIAGAEHRSESHIGFALDGGVYLGFDQADVTRTGGAGPTVWFDVDNLDEVYERFVALGAAVRYTPELKPMGDVLASLYDLDGNVFGLVQR